jgi:hypothetical protein
MFLFTNTKRNNLLSSVPEYGFTIVLAFLAVSTGTDVSGTTLSDLFTALGTKLGTLATPITAQAIFGLLSDSGT